MCIQHWPTHRVRKSVLYVHESSRVKYLMLSHVISLYYSYVKTYLLPDQSKSTKKKTSVKKGVDPIFNETIKVVTIITCGDVYQ